MFITDLSTSNFNIQIYIRYIDMYVNTFACIKRITASLISRCSTSIYIHIYVLLVYELCEQICSFTFRTAKINITFRKAVLLLLIQMKLIQNMILI